LLDYQNNDVGHSSMMDNIAKSFDISSNPNKIIFRSLSS